MTEENMEYLSVRTPREIVEKFDRIAKRMNVKRSVVLRWALETFDESFFLTTYLLKEVKSTEGGVND